MVDNLASHIDEERHRQFIGRSVERQLFRSLIEGPMPSARLIYIHGPGGIGKTTLLKEFHYISRKFSLPVIFLDLRDLDPQPNSFLMLLEEKLLEANLASSLKSFQKYPGTVVILLDSFELMAPLSEWFKEKFLPQLPAAILLILASRHPPPIAFIKDAGLKPLIRILPLRNFSQQESQKFLTLRNVPAQQHVRILGFTHGHPLALSLIADVFDQRPDIDFQPRAAPDIILLLLKQFIQKVPGPAHRRVLEICALAHHTTESLLSAVLAMENVHELFEWLRGLSFVETGPHGVFPHELAREIICADLRWRHPDLYADLHHRIRRFYNSRLAQTSLEEQQRILQEYIFLHRENPVVKPFFDWSEEGSIYYDELQSADRPILLEAIQKFENATSRSLVKFWMEKWPRSVQVFRNLSGQTVGMLISLPLEQLSTSEMQRDWVVEKVWQYLQANATLRRGERAILFRFWFSVHSYQKVSAVQSRIFVNIVQQYLTTPSLAHTFFVCHNPAFWQPVLEYADLKQLKELEFEVDRKPFGVFGHDWRQRPPNAWLELLAQREISDESKPASMPQPQRTLLVLNEEEFSWAVSQALKHLHDSSALQANPLLRSRLVTEKVRPNTHELEYQVVLVNILTSMVTKLSENPRTEKYHPAVYRTYISPARSQEQAAEMLGLPFSTYRRYLKRGTNWIIQQLWQMELSGASPAN